AHLPFLGELEPVGGGGVSCGFQKSCHAGDGYGRLGAEVGLEHGDLALADFCYGNSLDLEEGRIDAVLSGGEDRGLCAAVALARGQEGVRVEHAVEGGLGPFGGDDLARGQGQTVFGVDDSDLAGGDFGEGHFLDFVDQRPVAKVPAGGKDIGLHTLLAVDGDV